MEDETVMRQHRPKASEGRVSKGTRVASSAFCSMNIRAHPHPTPRHTKRTRTHVNLKNRVKPWWDHSIRSGLHLESHIALLEEVDNLVRGCHTRIVVSLQRLRPHLLLGEYHPLHVLVTNCCLHLFGLLWCHVAQIAEIWLLFQHFQHVILVYHFWAGCVDEAAALRHTH